MPHLREVNPMLMSPAPFAAYSSRALSIALLLALTIQLPLSSSAQGRSGRGDDAPLLEHGGEVSLLEHDAQLGLAPQPPGVRGWPPAAHAPSSPERSISRVQASGSVR